MTVKGNRKVLILNHIWEIREIDLFLSYLFGDRDSSSSRHPTIKNDKQLWWLDEFEWNAFWWIVCLFIYAFYVNVQSTNIRTGSSKKKGCCIMLELQSARNDTWMEIFLQKYATAKSFIIKSIWENIHVFNIKKKSLKCFEAILIIDIIFIIAGQEWRRQSIDIAETRTFLNGISNFTSKDACQTFYD